MKGRIYDPTLGRFMQADPFIQSPNNSQSYNRYAYVMNNPMSYTDPSGYIGIPLLKKANRAIIKGAVKVFGAQAVAIFGNIATAACGVAAPVCAFHFNYNFSRATGASSSGALRAAFTAAASAYTFQQIGGINNISNGQRVFLHAYTGGVISVLQGGKFGHGFVSAGLTKALNINEIVGTAHEDATFRIIVAAVVGGTISKISGGKFSNGAITAAFAQAFNANQEARKDQYMKDIRQAIFNEQDYKKSVTLAVDYLELDITIPKDIVIDFNTFGAAATVSTEGVLSFYKDAFASAERLISTVGHEYVHLEQWNRGTLVNLSQNRQQYFMNEIEATQWELNNVNITGYEHGFVRNFNQRKSYFDKLTEVNQRRVIRGIYEATN